MKKSKLTNMLRQYASAPRNPDHNFCLALEYEELNQFASALSFYLRCAELSVNDDLEYECLLKSWLCINKLGNRRVFEKGQLLTAIAQSPNRPEAYYFLCQWLELNGGTHLNTKEEVFKTLYAYACIGTANLASEKPFKTFVDYPGSYGLLFYKAYSAWHVGQVEQAKKLTIDLWDNHPLNPSYKNHVWNNIVNLGLENEVKMPKSKE